MKSDGLCLPHLKKIVHLISIDDNLESNILQIILNKEKHQIVSLINELKEFQRKHDYRFVDEGFGEEKDSWKRAVDKISGKFPD